MDTSIQGGMMAELEVFIKYPDNKYGEGIMIEEYNDRISLVLAQEGQGNGTVWKKWVFPQNKERMPMEKAIPHKIYLGHNRETAIDMLRQIAMHLKGAK